MKEISSAHHLRSDLYIKRRKKHATILVIPAWKRRRHTWHGDRVRASSSNQRYETIRVVASPRLRTTKKLLPRSRAVYIPIVIDSVMRLLYVSIRTALCVCVCVRSAVKRRRRRPPPVKILSFTLPR